MELQEQDWAAELAAEWGESQMHPNWKDGQEYEDTIKAYNEHNWPKVVALILAYRMIHS